MSSIWEQTVQMPSRPTLKGNICTQVAIIGGGMTGILLADKLMEVGKSVVVLEANTVGSGQTAGTTAKITAQHGQIYEKLMKRYGAKKSAMYAKAQLEAVDRFRQLIQARNIDCDFQICRSFLYTSENRKASQLEAAAQASLGLPSYFTSNVPLPFYTVGAVCMENQALFHPLRFLKGLSAGVTVYEHTPVRRVEQKHLITDSGVVTADFIVFACHYPFMDTPMYYTRTHQQRSMVLALEGVPSLTDMYYGMDAHALSIRPFEEWLLVGGGTARTGKGAVTEYAALERKARMWFPQGKVIARWTAQDCIPTRDFSYIGRFSEKHLNWFVATGYRKWGMTTSMVAAEMLCDMICGKEHPLEDIFAPDLLSPYEIFPIAANGYHTIKNYAGYLLPQFKKPEKLALGQGGAVGMTVGAYRESTAALHKVSLRCTHRGCKLHWNAANKTWECPCHGSCFDKHGKRLEGPAKSDIQL